MTKINGINVDDFGRCSHWHQEFDVIANKCNQCQHYFTCYLCHNSTCDHEFVPAPHSNISVMCGVCHLEMSGSTYPTLSQCPNCQHAFNPRCHLHQDIYFC